MGPNLPIEVEEVAPLSPSSAATATNITILSQPSTKRTIARSTSFVFFTFQLVVVIIIAIAFTLRDTIHESSSTTLAGNSNATQESLPIIHKIISTTRYNNVTTNKDEADEEEVVSAIGGSWKYDAKDNQAPYNFSQQMCLSSYINKGDCTKNEYCRNDLMNWRYLDKNGTPYPKFDVAGFREKMKNRRIVFVGSSLIRQQVQALVWTLGHTNVKWRKVKSKIAANCTTTRFCFTDLRDNISICYQFMGSMATQVYHEGNYTLDHSLRGFGDSSCLLGDNVMSKGLTRFDLVFVQNIAWYTNLRKLLDSPTSPSEWVAEMTPIVYYDAMKELLTKISKQTKTVVTLGQTGTKCKDKTNPQSFSIQEIPDNFGWRISDKLWNASLRLIKNEQELSSVQIVDAREPLMQSVHAHPQQAKDNPLQADCLHFCMKSAAINMYLDMYWNEVFSQY